MSDSRSPGSTPKGPQVSGSLGPKATGGRPKAEPRAGSIPAPPRDCPTCGCPAHPGVHCYDADQQRYATIVADPPWHYGRKFNAFSSTRDKVKGSLSDGPRDLPYPTMSLDEIKTLPVGELAAEAAHLYLWATQKHLWQAPEVVEAWGFQPGVLLTWCKQPRGVGLGDAFTPTSEFVLFAHRGGLRPLSRHESTWFMGKRAKHSQKPEVLLDIVERVSPGPYLEMFARRNRLGWHTWGNESLQHVEVIA